MEQDPKQAHKMRCSNVLDTKDLKLSKKNQIIQQDLGWSRAGSIKCGSVASVESFDIILTQNIKTLNRCDMITLSFFNI